MINSDYNQPVQANDKDRDPALEKQILTKLAILNPLKITLNDESYKHKGHRGVLEKGGRHYHLSISSDAFNNLNLIKQHQLIYVTLGALIGNEIHALRITIL